MTSILPVSGALQLKTSEAKGERPMTSQMCAYSRFVRPAPYLYTSRTIVHKIVLNCTDALVKRVLVCWELNLSPQYWQCLTICFYIHILFKGISLFPPTLHLSLSKCKKANVITLLLLTRIVYLQ